MKENSEENFTLRRTGRVLLLNESNEILLIKINDTTVIETDGTTYPSKWITIGGQVEDGESEDETALRELKEETGIDNIVLSPLMWTEEYELLWKGNLTKIKDYFFLAKTKSTHIGLQDLSKEESYVHKEYKWWSLSELKVTNEKIIPSTLPEMLEKILNNKFS